MRLHELTQPCNAPDADQLWRQFLEARATALRTLQINDGIRAGRAFAAFLHAFQVSPIAGRPQ
jgi:hypothetical protein